ncbi:MAG: hypothetical protein U9P14_04845, partial [Gemmatimonadota bacterium]|nr:hypothetical protein [Gemmatimonadota bacterium]
SLQAIRIICDRDSLWRDFFFDLDIQLKEPNIMRFIFRDGQKWKSYALNELMYSRAFQELLLSLGNFGIAGSKDGKQFIDGWPEDLRWKYREYSIEVIPEDEAVETTDFTRSRRPGRPTASDDTRLMPLSPMLNMEAADSTEPPHEVPRL